MAGDYTPSGRFSDAIPARRGDRLLIVDAAHGGWLLVEDLAGTRGWVPRAGVTPDGAGAVNGAEDPEEAATLREQAYWALLGLGCTWFLNDSMFLQLPWWVASQPEGLKIGAEISFANAIGPFIAIPLHLAARKYYPAQHAKMIVPVLLALSLLAGYLLALGFWKISSWFIFVSMFAVASVGACSSFAVVPWIFLKQFKPALISNMYFGGSFGSLMASLLSIYQSPGERREFSPSAFFFILTVLITLCAPYAYYSVAAKGIGLSSRPPPPASLRAAAPAAGRRATLLEFLPNRVEVWWRDALPLAIFLSVVGMFTWNVMRAVVGFATTHTVKDHHLCRPHCTETCADAMTAVDCGLLDMCREDTTLADSSSCVENRGEYWLGWTVALAQWSYTAGLGMTVLLPRVLPYNLLTQRHIMSVGVLWGVSFGIVFVVAMAGGGTFETGWAGPLVVFGASMVRATDGYMGILAFRYIPVAYPEDSEAIVIFFGVVGIGINLMGSMVTTWLVESGVLSD